MKRLRIYVAGPITSEDPEIVEQNIENARAIGRRILQLGHLPYVPHAHFSNWEIDTNEMYDLLQLHGEDVLEKWADALFFIAPSNGANAERAKAEKLGLKIFTSLGQIPRFGE